MGKIISVEPAQLTSIGGKLEEYANSFDEIYKELLRQAETMGEAWQGADNLAYVEQIKGITTKMNLMVEKLKSASITLKQQAKNYDDKRSDNIAQVKKLNN